MKKILYSFLFLIVFIVACGTPNDMQDPIEEELVDAEFRDFSGVDNCTWVIELPDGARLEPINLSDFDVLPLEGKAILISYIERLDMASTCQVGTIIELETLEAK